jgi:rifampicin phosphotransferase
MAGTTIDTGEQLRFDPPGPGSWGLDKTHVVHPPTPVHLASMPEVFAAAFERTFARFGIPAAGQQLVPIHGFVYSQLIPAAPDQLAEREAAATEAIATKRWRRDLERWDAVTKPASIERHLALAAVDPATDLADDAALADHLGTLFDHLRAMIDQHHEFNGAAMIPLGDFLAHAMDWTGRPMSELLELFVGASPTSTGDCPALGGEARSLLEAAGPDADPAELLERLRAADAGVARWLDLVGHRVVDGFDVDHPTALERPAVLVSCLRRALGGSGSGPSSVAADVEAKVAAVRAQVPAEHRDAFDDLYREARDCYRLRDERGIYSDSGAWGLMRRGLLEAGRRLVARGALDGDETLALEASIDELTALLAGGADGGPTAEELAARRRTRRRWSVADAPATIGDPPGPPPPLELLPPAMARMTRAILTVSGSMASDPATAQAPRTASSLRGSAGSPGIHEGRAVVVLSVDDLEGVEEGDVIVAVTTSESFNLALSLASAVVTDQGGLLSHAAILAREYGVPAVVGTGDATVRIPGGTIVRVDGTAGEVSW